MTCLLDNGNAMARQADPRVRARIAKNLRRLLGTMEIGVAAKKMKMPQAQLSGYINGHRGFSIETLIRFAVNLNCSLDDVVNGVDVEYARSAAKRLHAELESDEDLLDVITGFELIRRDNTAEAKSIAAIFKSRILSFADPVPRADESDVQPSAGAREKARRTVQPPATPRRRGWH